jgi:hypothetical protein
MGARTLIAVLLFLFFANAAAFADDPCIKSLNIVNTNAGEITITISGEGVFTTQRVGGKSSRVLSISPRSRLAITATGIATDTVTSAAGTVSSVYDYAQRLRDRNRAPTTAPTTGSGRATVPDAADARRKRRPRRLRPCRAAPAFTATRSASAATKPHRLPHRQRRRRQLPQLRRRRSVSRCRAAAAG